MLDRMSLPKYIKSASLPDSNGNVHPEWLVRNRDPNEKDLVTGEKIVPTMDELNRYYTTLACKSVPFSSQFTGTGVCWLRYEDVVHYDEV